MQGPQRFVTVNRFYFHMCTPQTRYDDTEGCEFESLEAAYLDTHRAVIEISAEMLANRQDPNNCAFEICGGDGEKLLTVGFQEVLRPATRQAPADLSKLHEGMARETARGRGLTADIAANLALMRDNLEALRQTVDKMRDRDRNRPLRE